MILTLQTNTFGFHGGIPAYNRIVCRALNQLSRKSVRVLVASDDPKVSGEHAVTLPNLNVSGFSGKRAAFVRAALKSVINEPVTMVLAGHINYAPLCLLLKLLKPQLKFGVFIYGSEVWEKVSFLKRRALKSADFIIAISEYTKGRAVEANGLDPQRISVLPNALEWDEDTAPSPQPEQPSHGPKLLSVGRLDGSERQKGFDDVIKALPLILSRVPDVRYRIVGTGTDLERHKQLALATGVSDRVDFLGALSEENLHNCYEACDVFVMPSAQEGFGFVYLEAMQYRKPIVAARSGGAPEVVEDGITGRLVSYGDEKQLARVLIELFQDPLLRRKLGEAGYQRLQENFTFAHFQNRLLEILRPESQYVPQPVTAISTLPPA